MKNINMNKCKQWMKDGIFSIIILFGSFFLNLFLEFYFETQSLIPMIFVLGVFLISVRTKGYFWGIASSIISVLAVNYVFTFPYYAFDLITPECLSSAIVMLIVSITTGALTTKIIKQEKIKADIEREHMRANLLRAISHDLRTPLTSIYGSCTAVMENYDFLKKEQQLKLLGEVREDAEWLIRMVENLLSVTKIDEKKVKLVKTPTVLDELIDAVLVKFHKSFPKQEVELELPDDFVSIPMDAVLIEQVLINILGNAVDHAKGMTELTLQVTCEDNIAKFTINDNGCGIPADRMKDLFTGYLDRNMDTSDSSRSNMGIGLSVCATIVKAHGSEIHAENRKEGGASFWFTLEMEE